MKERRGKWFLFIFLLSFYAIFFSGTFYASDEIIIARLSQSIVDSQRLDFPETYSRTNSPYGILNSLLGIPSYLVFKIFTRLLTAEYTFPQWNIFALMNILVASFLMLTFYHFLRTANYSLKTALSLSLLCGTTSGFLPYAKTFFTEPLFSLFLLLALLFIFRGWKDSEGLNCFFYAGLFLACAFHSRFMAIFYLPAFIIFILFTDDGALTHRIKRTLLFLTPVVVAIFLWMVLNYIVRGGIFRTGYEAQTFSGHFLVGIYGLLFSPGRGFFIYNPWAIAAFALFPFFYKQFPRLALLSLVLFLISLLSYAKFWTWHGGWTPGCRFLLPMVPLTFLWLTPLFSPPQGNTPYLSFWRRLSVLLFILSFALQVAMSLVNVLDYNNELFGLLEKEESPFLFIPQVSALAGIKHLLIEGKFDIALLKFPSAFTELIIAIYLFLLALLIYSGKRIYGIIRAEKGISRREVLSVLNKFKASLVIFICLILLSLVVKIFAGQRGLALQTDKGGEIQLDRRLRLDKPISLNLPEKYCWSGFLEMPCEKDFIFYLKVLGKYEMIINGQRIFFNNEYIPQHPPRIPRNKIQLNYGIYPIEINYQRYPQENALFYFYWTVPGEARYIEPIDGEYLFPTLPSSSIRFFTTIKRHLWLLFLTLLLPVFCTEAVLNKSN